MQISRLCHILRRRSNRRREVDGNTGDYLKLLELRPAMITLALLAVAILNCYSSTPFDPAASQRRSIFDRPFSDQSVWNKPISAHGKASYQVAKGLAEFVPGLSVWHWAAGSTTVWKATEDDPLVNLYFHGEAHTKVATGTWKRHGNSHSVESWILAGVDQTWLEYEANQYSSQSVNFYALPDDFKRRTEDYWALQAHVPRDAFPSLDVDGHMTIWQPNGWVLELNSTIGLSTGDLVSLMASYTDPRGLGTGLSNGRRATMIPNYAGVLRDGELSSNRIRHALAIALGPEALASNFVSPATAMDRAGHELNAGTIPYGALLAIPSSVAVESLGLQSDEGRVLAKAAQEYGMYVVDRSGPRAFVILADENATDVPAWSPELDADLRRIRDNLHVGTLAR